MRQYICFDIGGTSIKHGIIDENGVFLKKGSTPTEAQKYGGPGIMRKLHEIAAEYLTVCDAAGICVSTAGMVDCDSGVITYSAPLIPNYIGTQIKGELERDFSLPCEVENDVNCACLAEYFSGAAKGSESCLCLTVGTGIGGAYIEKGRMLHGFSGSGCEVGYMRMPGGEFQELAAASAMVRDAENRMNVPQGSLDGEKVFALAHEGDKNCIEAIDGMCRVLGMGIANICCVLNPQAVVLGGGIMAEKEFLYGRIRSEMDKFLVPRVAQHTTLTFAEHGNDAGMLGALEHFRSMQKTRV